MVLGLRSLNQVGDTAPPYGPVNTDSSFRRLRRVQCRVPFIGKWSEYSARIEFRSNSEGVRRYTVYSAPTRYGVLCPTCRLSSVLKAGDLESRRRGDKHGQPFPIFGANQRKGHSTIGLWTCYAFRSFGGLHRAIYGGKLRHASFNKYTQRRWCVGGGGSPTQLSSVFVCSRGVVQAPQRIKQTYSPLLRFPVNRHLPFCSCQYYTRYPVQRLTVITRTNSHVLSLTASILNQARKSWLFPLAWRHKQAALFDGSMSKGTFFDKQVLQAARLQALGELANSVRQIAVAGSYSSSSLPFPVF